VLKVVLVVHPLVREVGLFVVTGRIEGIEELKVQRK
jgi:hypothetical protein